METWLQDIFRWLPDGRPYYALLALISVGESVAGLGLLVPGSVITVFAGFLAFHGKGEIVWVAMAAGGGALAGDLVSYWLGARLGPPLFARGLLRKRRDLLQRAELFFLEHGGKSLFFGRFLGPLRGLIPFVAGSSQMSPVPFLAYTLISCFLWGIVYPGLGFIGGASWQQVRIWTGRFGILMVILLVLVLFDAFFWKSAAPRLSLYLQRLSASSQRQWRHLLARPPLRTMRRRWPRLWNFLAERFSLQHGSGLYLTAGFVASALFAFLFLWMVGDFQLLERLDRHVYSQLQELRHPAADLLLTAIAHLADRTSLLLLAGWLLFWLLIEDRDFSAVILAAGLAGGALLFWLVQQAFPPSPLPSAFPGLPAGLARPTGVGTFLFPLLCGLAVYFILGNFNQWRSRLRVVIIGSSLPLLLGFSRVYLGVERVSSLLAGFALAALWLTFLITASEVRRRYAGEFPWRRGWQPLHLQPRHRRTLLIVAALLATAALVCYIGGEMGRA